MVERDQDSPTEDIEKIRAKLEALGYRTGHLTAAEIEELVRQLEKEQPVTNWRVKL